MASIGGQSFITLRGSVTAQAQALTPIERPGVDGVGYRQKGKRGEVVTLTSVADTNNATTTTAAYVALRGTLVTVVEDAGRTSYYVAVLDVIITRVRAVSGAVGGLTAGAYLVDATWTLQPTAL